MFWIYHLRLVKEQVDFDRCVDFVSWTCFPWPDPSSTSVPLHLDHVRVMRISLLLLFDVSTESILSLFTHSIELYFDIRIIIGHSFMNE